MRARRRGNKSTSGKSATSRDDGANATAKKAAPPIARRRLSASKRARKAAAAAGNLMTGGNVLVVNIIPRSLSDEFNQDSEPNLAVNPANPLQIAASAFTPNPNETGNAPIFISSDGGSTWSLNAIVTSDVITADITLRFSDTSNNLYAGIISRPVEIISGVPVPRLKILRTNNFAGAQPMKVLVNRRGSGVDQPYIQAATVSSGANPGKDTVFVGDNDFNDPNGRTATIDFSNNAGAAIPGFKSVRIDSRNPDAVDAPSIRPAIHPDGTVYGAFLHRLSVGGSDGSLRRYDVVVVRDDNFARSTPRFASLKDPMDNRSGRIVVHNTLIPWLPGAPFGGLGQERTGSSLSIAIDPRNSSTVYIAWANRVGTDDYTLHVRRSMDRGVTWSPNDLRTIANATNPALAVNSDGRIGFLYQQLDGAGAAQRFVTHFRRSADGISWDDLVLSTAPANAPVSEGAPYLGDYIHLQAVGRDFFGIFSANNTPDLANFPNGVAFQRNHDFNTRKLLGTDQTSEVPVSIDPFFFRVIES